MSRITGAIAVAVVLAAATACATTVGGTGARAGLPGASSRPDFPSASPSSAGSPSPSSPAPSGSSAAAVGCPTAFDPNAGLRYACIAPGLTVMAAPPWSLQVSRQVDTDWFVAEGSGSLSTAPTGTLPQTAAAVTSQLLDSDYGTNPTSTTVSAAATTIAGKPAYLQQTMITLDPAFVAKANLKVKREQLWLAVINTASAHDPVWFVTIPDVVSNLWPAVPAVIKTIQLR